MGGIISGTALVSGLYFDCVNLLIHGNHGHVGGMWTATLAALAGVTLCMPFFIIMTFLSDWMRRTFPNVFGPKG